MNSDASSTAHRTPPYTTADLIGSGRILDRNPATSSEFPDV